MCVTELTVLNTQLFLILTFCCAQSASVKIRQGEFSVYVFPCPMCEKVRATQSLLLQSDKKKDPL